MNDKKTITITMEEYKLLLEKQKQVDELKEKIMNLKSAMIDRVARKSYDNLLTMPEDVEEIFGDAYESEFNKFLAQTVKDTAKEICDLILEHWEKKQFVECDWLRVAISEKYCVEVE